MLYSVNTTWEWLCGRHAPHCPEAQIFGPLWARFHFQSQWVKLGHGIHVTCEFVTCLLGWQHEDATRGIYHKCACVHGGKYTSVIGEKLWAPHKLTKVLPTTKAMWYIWHKSWLMKPILNYVVHALNVWYHSTLAISTHVCQIINYFWNFISTNGIFLSIHHYPSRYFWFGRNSFWNSQHF
jgi:hypothetical protein